MLNISSMWDVKEPTHKSRSVRYEVPGVVAVHCEDLNLLKQINYEQTNGFLSSMMLGIFFLSFAFSIFVAFILEAFMLEYSITHGKIETVFNKKIEETGIGVGM